MVGGEWKGRGLTGAGISERVFGRVVGEEGVFGGMEGDVDFHEDEEEERASHCFGSKNCRDGLGAVLEGVRRVCVVR